MPLTCFSASLISPSDSTQLAIFNSSSLVINFWRGLYLYLVDYQLPLAHHHIYLFSALYQQSEVIHIYHRHSLCSKESSCIIVNRGGDGCYDRRISISQLSRKSFGIIYVTNKKEARGIVLSVKLCSSQQQKALPAMYYITFFCGSILFLQN